MSKTILITGGAGFIGSHVVRLFVTKYPEYKIVNLDALTYAGNLENLKDIEAQVDSIEDVNVRYTYPNIVNKSQRFFMVDMPTKNLHATISAVEKMKFTTQFIHNF